MRLWLTGDTQKRHTHLADDSAEADEHGSDGVQAGDQRIDVQAHVRPVQRRQLQEERLGEEAKLQTHHRDHEGEGHAANLVVDDERHQVGETYHHHDEHTAEDVVPRVEIVRVGRVVRNHLPVRRREEAEKEQQHRLKHAQPDAKHDHRVGLPSRVERSAYALERRRGRRPRAAVPPDERIGDAAGRRVCL